MKTYPKPRKWFPKHPEKYVGNFNNIISRSSWELRFMNYCDISSNVVKWNSEDTIIPYISPVDGKPHRYFVDFTATIRQKDGTTKTFLIEIKPFTQTIPPKSTRNKRVLMESVATYQINQAKWEAAREFCQRRGFEFMIVTEYQLGIKTK